MGGNQGNVVGAIDKALRFLVQPPIITLIARAPIYRTAAVGGPSGQPDYLNTVVRVSTALGPRELLDRCLEVERQLGRVRNERWGPRTIDLDVVLHGNNVVDEPGLAVPHPRLRDRLFVLVPLADIAPKELALPPDGMEIGDALSELLVREGVSIQQFKSQILF